MKYYRKAAENWQNYFSDCKTHAILQIWSKHQKNKKKYFLSGFYMSLSKSHMNNKEKLDSNEARDCKFGFKYGLCEFPVGSTLVFQIWRLLRKGQTFQQKAFENDIKLPKSCSRYGRESAISYLVYVNSHLLISIWFYYGLILVLILILTWF